MPGAAVDDVVLDRKDLRIRLADSHHRRSSASMLINRMYSWRGYNSSHDLHPDPNRITLTASNAEDVVVGTVTLVVDSPSGLHADETFKDELDKFRRPGRRLCELTKLAFEPIEQSKAALAALFHLCYIYGRKIEQCTDVFIEVNPRHRGFYRTMLGFHQRGPVRTNARVNAPAYLLWLGLDYVDEQIRMQGGKGSGGGRVRSLYPYFFSRREEEGIMQRLISLN